MMTKKEGDLYWSQISMWDFSHKDNVDAYSIGGFHYELFVITKIVSENHRKVRHVKVGELTPDEITRLIPNEGHNWNRVMGNDLSLLNE